MFVDDAHDLHYGMLVDIKRLTRMVVDGNGSLAIVLAASPRLAPAHYGPRIPITFCDDPGRKRSTQNASGNTRMCGPDEATDHVRVRPGVARRDPALRARHPDGADRRANQVGQRQRLQPSPAEHGLSGSLEGRGGQGDRDAPQTPGLADLGQGDRRCHCGRTIGTPPRLRAIATSNQRVDGAIGSILTN